MSHHIYHTEGIILAKTPIGEANYFFHILTKDFGVITAMAQGVREIKSKLRFHLQPFSYGDIDLVRGREVWRITNANTLRSFLYLVRQTEKIAFYIRLTLFLRRFMPGEKAHEEVFSDFLTALCFLEDNKLGEEALKNLEAILVMRILNDLGYWEEDRGVSGFLTNGEWSLKLLSNFSPHRTKIHHRINIALRESHL